MNFIKMLLSLFVSTLNVNVIIDISKLSIKGYIDGVKVLDALLKPAHSLWKFTLYFDYDDKLIQIFYKEREIFSSDKYSNIVLNYSNGKITINGFPIKF